MSHPWITWTPRLRIDHCRMVMHTTTSIDYPIPIRSLSSHPNRTTTARYLFGTYYTPWPVGFLPSPPGNGVTSSPSSKPGPERDHRRVHTRPMPPSTPNCSATPQYGHVRTRTQTVLTLMSRGAVGETYEVTLLPLRVMYPAPSVHTHMSHSR
ncbi:hypothetical protein OG21DRAFT_902309 [Imleria badia]|nr:hypothetical protein OG21DRAFT_902309 [Imleria badia]